MTGIVHPADLQDLRTFAYTADPPDPDDWDPCPTCDGCGWVPATEQGDPLPLGADAGWYSECPDCTVYDPDNGYH